MAEMREKLMHFFNIGTADEQKYVLLGDGITSLTEEFNPETETKQYINQSNGTTNVKSYTPSIAVTKEYIKDDELQKWIDEKIKILPTGSSAQSDYIRINILETAVEGAYPAVKRKCTYQFDNIGGDAGSELSSGFTLGGVGDGIQGTFDVKTKTFTEKPAQTSAAAQTSETT